MFIAINSKALFLHVFAFRKGYVPACANKKSAMDMRFPNFQDHEAFEVPSNVGSIPFSSPNLGKSWESSLNPEQPLKKIGGAFNVAH